MSRRNPKTGRTARAEIRLAPDELAVLREAADIAGETLSEWLREAALDRALRELQAAGSHD